jgi:hypothetical protein
MHKPLSKLQPVFWFLKRASAIGNWWAGISVLWTTAAKVLGALVTGATILWNATADARPATLPAWFLFVGHALLLGLGVWTLLGLLTRTSKYVRAPSRFRDLPRSHKAQLLRMSFRDELWDTEPDETMYQDLVKLGLVSARFESHGGQVRAGLTRAGRNLATDWDWERTLASAEVAVVKYGADGRKFLLHLQYQSNPWPDEDKWLAYPVFVAGERMAQGKVFQKCLLGDPVSHVEFVLTNAGRRAIGKWYPRLSIERDRIRIPLSAISDAPAHFKP